MNRIFLIADTHFEDETINDFECRPFENTEVAKMIMTERWNSVVDNEDTVYLLGDVFGENATNASIGSILKSLNGLIVIIVGNHDNPAKLVAAIKAAGLDEKVVVINTPIIIDGFFMLSHEPMYINKTMPYCNIFGHVHANPIYPTVGIRHYCVSVERIDYTPIDFEVVKHSIHVENKTLK